MSRPCRPRLAQSQIVPAPEYAGLFLDENGPTESAITVVLAIVGAFSVFIIFDIITRKHQRVQSELATVELVKAEVERESLQQQQLFAGMVAHEIRSPSSAICGAIDILRETVLSQEQETLLHVVDDGAKQILTLAEDLMNQNTPGHAGAPSTHFSLDPKLVSPRRDIIDIAWETSRLQKRYAEKVAGLRMVLEVAEDIPTVAMVDASRARQVISNLLGNAVRIRRRGPSVSARLL